MKICVFGAGATGGHFAALLHRAGHDVSVVVRGTNLAAIRGNGLTLHLHAGGVIDTVVAKVRASDDARELGVQDVVLVTLKSYALPAAAAAIAPLLGRDTAVVFLQNGIPWWYHHGEGGAREGRRLPRIDPGGALWNAIGPQRAVGGITASACTLVAPGVVEVKGGNGALTFGEPDGSDSHRVRAIAQAFREAGFAPDVTPKIRDAIWTKLALNLGSGPLGVLAPVPLKEMFASQVMVDTRFRIQAEVAAVAEAMGCSVKIDFGAQMRFARQSPHVPSVAQDAAAGRRIELETMFLAPLRIARDVGVSTPSLDLLVGLCALKHGGGG